MLAQEEAFSALKTALERDRAVIAEGLWGSSARALAAAAIQRGGPSVTLYCVAHIDQAEDVRDELSFFTGRPVALFPAWESYPRESDVSDEVLAGRLSVLKILEGFAQEAQAAEGLVIVAPVQALLQPVPARDRLNENTLTLEVGQERDPERLRVWLVERGFQPADLINAPGEFSARGGIVDVYPPASSRPLRVEFFGDSVESIRTFDPATQRSVDELSSAAITFLPPGQTAPKNTCTLLHYLPEETLAIWQDPLEVAEMGRSFVARLASPVGVYEYEGIARQREAFRKLDLWSFTAAGGEASRHAFNVRSVQRFSGKVEQTREELAAVAAENDVLVFCDNEGEQQRLVELLIEIPDEVRERITLALGMLLEGFHLAAAGVLVTSNHELFQRYRVRRRMASRPESRPIDSFLELGKGDLVVHLAHGIARYLGVKTLTQGGKTEDFLTLEFREGAKLYVPASHVHLVQKYVGGFKGKANLSKLGGKAWAQKKQRVKEAVRDLAQELLETEAARATRPGHAFPSDTLWMREFEASFPYSETDDQLAAMEEIKRDMAAPRAMERLICGDVGYGKTELAIRAAFKAAEAGKQSAVLVPTTVLADQHGRTFRERLADYPVTVEVISRFLSRGQQREVLDRLRKGVVDVLIGTHRLLSGDVDFADLGLLVIDEEQRFGVEHKERMKRFRRTVDTLTLTATPIPRTLHMSLLGIRDISSLATPPQDRRAIHTEVCRWDAERIREAILRELNRDGQVFFVHNRIYNIREVTAELAALVPEARITWAHGRMSEHELEHRMHDFLQRDIDVLVCTTIIESGLDIPTANTMFIDMADLFGLAELHQLRGRIGRYKHRGYCYLLLPRTRPIRPAAVRRLKAIEEFSELGSGFQIAMRDLEIRGAGNILGPEQSGHITAVGYELYCRLLEQAIRGLRGMEAEEEFEPTIDLGASAYLPRDCAPGDRQRMTVYRMINRARTVERLEEVRRDVEDMLGKLSRPAEFLFDLQEIRIHARRWRIGGIKTAGNDVVFTVDTLDRIGSLLSDAPGKVRVANEHTVHLRLRPETVEPLRLLVLLKKLLAKAPGQAPTSGDG